MRLRELNRRNAGTKPVRGRAGVMPLRSRDTEFGEELAQGTNCKPADVGCWTNRTLLGGHRWVPRLGARRGNRG